MNFFYKLERKYKRYAIPNLMYYIIIMYGAGLLMEMFAPDFYIRFLRLDAQAILHGQIWRIVTFVIYPPGGGILGSLISMYLYYMVGSALERVWGPFRFNVYFFMGIAGHVAASLVLYVFFRMPVFLTTEFLNFSLFFAFAATFPDMEFLLFFVIPIKAKWLGLFDGIYFLYWFVKGGTSIRVTIVLSLINFILFFFMTRNFKRVNPIEIKRRRDFRRQSKVMPQGSTHHKCAVCGRTEKDDPNLEFRYCSKCEGGYEYCAEHLYTHKHVTREENEAGEQ